MTKQRKTLINTSNNADNNNVNICSLAVANKIGVVSKYKYLHTIEDLIRAVRRADRIKCTRVAKLCGSTIQDSSKYLKQLSIWHKTLKTAKPHSYIIWLKDHVLLLDSNGNYIVDTDPRKIDRRKVYGCWMIEK